MHVGWDISVAIAILDCAEERNSKKSGPLRNKEMPVRLQQTVGRG